MNTRIDTLRASKICRFCLSEDEKLTSLYDRSRAPKHSATLRMKILCCMAIEIFPSNKAPLYICERCKFFMEVSYEFKQICRQADENIMDFITHGAPLSSKAYPPTLAKMYQLSPKKPAENMLKTVVGIGTTVQVVNQGGSDSDDGEDGVYKIGLSESGSDIKVISSKSNTDASKIKTLKGFTSVTKLQRHVRAHAGERSYPCKYCDKSFLKSHHYTRHLRLKHRETLRSARGPFGEMDHYRCEQCDDSFTTQDELIYHSAIHATQNLICPLCQEKFEDVDAVTTHIKSHVNGMDIMCDYCELVFTTKDKLDAHLNAVHEDELRNEEDESSMDMEANEEDEDVGINVKEEDDHMVVEIKKADEFMLPNLQDDIDDKGENTTNSEDSDGEADLSATEIIPVSKKETIKPLPEKPKTSGVSVLTTAVASKTSENDNQTASILRRAEEIKRKAQQQNAEMEKKEKANSKAENNNTCGASDKSLRLLEKELQDLKRTNSRSEIKAPAKPSELARNRRIPIHTSTPKIRATEEKKISTKSPVPDKKQLERRPATKDIKDNKEVKNNNSSIKEEKEKENKEKETPKAVVKNGAKEKNVEEGVRRSTRPSKIKNYAKMIRDRSQNSEDDAEDDDSDDADDEEYKDSDKSPESRPKLRRSSIKQTPKTPATPTTDTPTPVRKRGRPRKEQPVPTKVAKKDEVEESKTEDNESDDEPKSEETTKVSDKESSNKNDDNTNNITAKPSTSETESKSLGTLVSPTGQTLKKVPIKALPPGVKPLPLPVNARPMSTGEVCEMQIGKKVVKVQKIVMTKAEVEAMAKKGLVEMKDGTMVLKQGIKIPTADPASLKSTLVGDETKESPVKKDKAIPTRCNIGENI